MTGIGVNSIVLHEIGHTFGLSHGNESEDICHGCTNIDCNSAEYGIMRRGGLGINNDRFNTLHKHFIRSRTKSPGN